MATILVGTSDGLRTVASDGERRGAAHLAGHAVRAVAAETPTRLWAIVDDREIWRSNGGDDWSCVARLDGVAGGDELTATCLAHTRGGEAGGVLVGTSRARLLRIAPDLRAEFVRGFDDAPSRAEWYTPWGAPADTRTISADDRSVFVNVHVGGVLRSRDGGASWQPTIDMHADVHRVTTGRDRVYAAGAFGLSVSEDGGDSWRLATDGLHARYCRAVALCGDTVLLSASEGPGGRRAALYRSGPAAERFERCRTGLPEWFDDNVDSTSLDALPGGELAVAGTLVGEVYASADQGATWSRVADGLGTINCVLAVP
jgi:hypothetical protein